MITYIPYDEIKKDERNYEIMLLRDLHNKTFTDISEKFGVSLNRAVQIYNRIKFRQVRLYIRYIALTLGYESEDAMQEMYVKAQRCYGKSVYISTYLEKKYGELLTEYRNGEPGMPKKLIEALPPFKAEISETEILRIVELHDIKKFSFKKIGIELNITDERARHEYRVYYTDKITKFLNDLRKENEELYEKKKQEAKLCYERNISLQKCYKMITADCENI